MEGAAPELRRQEAGAPGGAPEPAVEEEPEERRGEQLDDDKVQQQREQHLEGPLREMEPLPQQSRPPTIHREPVGHQ